MSQTQLYPYQVAGVRSIRDCDGITLLGDEVGLGKTLQALTYAWKHLPQDPAGPIVIVVPAHLKETWRRQAQQHLNIRVEVLYHEKRPPDKLPPLGRNHVYVINYDILTPPDWKSGTRPADDSWVSWLAALRPRLLIGDEGHYLSNPDSARSRAFRWLAWRCPRTLILTGTPLPNKPGDLWSLINILWPDEFPSRFEFGTRYAYPVKERGRWVYKGARNLDELHQRLKEKGFIRRRKADVLSDLPSVIYDVIPLEADLTQYKQAEADVLDWLRSQDALAAERASRAAELAKLSTLTQLAAEAKLDHVVRWVRDFLEESEGKLLIGAIHYKVTEALMDSLPRHSVLVDGRVSESRKNAAFDMFNLDPKCRVLVGNIHAAGTGWSCTSTSDVALVEIPWRPADVTQFAGRVHGVGRGVSGGRAHVRFLVAANTVEERLCEGIQRKATWAAQAVDGDSSVADLDIFDQIRSGLLAR